MASDGGTMKQDTKTRSYKAGSVSLVRGQSVKGREHHRDPVIAAYAVTGLS